jgi:hypothetical protein
MGWLTAIALVGAAGFGGLELGVEAAAVTAALTRECERAETVAVAPPRTPLAARTEVHMRCRGVLGDGRVDDADFLIADGRLRMIELRGPEVAQWVAARVSSEGTLLADFTVHANEGVILGGDARRAWIINPDDIRSYAFLQNDPFAVSADQAESSLPSRPPALEMGASLDDVSAQLIPACSSHAIRKLEPDKHPLRPQSHVQIDCYGYDFLGFPRLIEAVFADDALTHAWVLTTAREEARNRAALVAHYGEAIRSGEAFEVYGDGTVALRKDDNPEVLFMSETMAEFFAANMPGQGAPAADP